jgi:hypothetical protein
MSSDDIRMTDAGAFRYAGAGLPYTFRCDKCGKPTPNLGRRRAHIGGGVKIMVGTCCQVSLARGTPSITG